MPRKTKQPPSRHRAKAGRTSGGTPADRLIRAWLDEEDDILAELAEELIADGRDGVFSAAIRKLAEKHEDETVRDFAGALTELAETVLGQDGVAVAQLVVLPAVSAGSLPDAAALARSLAEAQLSPLGAETRFAEAWCPAEAVGSLPPAATRRVLLDLLRGQPPADLSPLPPGEVPEGEMVVLPGVLFHRTLPDIGDTDMDPDARAAELSEAYDRWVAALPPEVTEGALLLPLCTPSRLVEEIEALLEEVTADDPELAEILDFVETARAEAGDEEVAVRLLPVPEGVALTVLTRSGRELDSRSFALGENSLTAEAIRGVIERHVPVLDDPA